jgi:hypothetical protein
MPMDLRHLAINRRELIPQVRDAQHGAKLCDIDVVFPKDCGVGIDLRSLFICVLHRETMV